MSVNKISDEFIEALQTPEDLVITKAVAQRPKDLADIDAIISAVPNLDSDRVRS